MCESLPIIPQKSFYKIAFDAGKSYWWSCGKQPFCDGSRKGSAFDRYKRSTD